MLVVFVGLLHFLLPPNVDGVRMTWPPRSQMLGDQWKGLLHLYECDMKKTSWLEGPKILWESLYLREYKVCLLDLLKTLPLMSVRRPHPASGQVALGVLCILCSVWRQHFELLRPI